MIPRGGRELIYSHALVPVIISDRKDVPFSDVKLPKITLVGSAYIYETKGSEGGSTREQGPRWGGGGTSLFPSEEFGILRGRDHPIKEVCVYS